MGRHTRGPALGATLLAAGLAVLAASARGQEGPSPADGFLGRPDEPILASLRSEPIAQAERGNGGLSLGFRVVLADGTRAYFKPAQDSIAMSWRAELAAFHLDRELGLGRVAPSVGRRIAWSELEPAAGNDRRTATLRIDDEGRLPGALIWWVDEPLVPLALAAGWERWLRIEGRGPRVSPFQRPSQIRAGDRLPRPRTTPEPDVPDRPAELSDMIVFDYLAHNADRWGGDDTNVRTVGRGGRLMFLDNGAAFTLRRARLALMDHRLAQAQRFRRSTIDAVRAFDVERFERRLDGEPLAPLLGARQLANLETRRRHLLAHVDALLERHGPDAVYAW